MGPSRCTLLLALSLGASVAGCANELDDDAETVSGAAAEDDHGRVRRSAAELTSRLTGATLTFKKPVTLTEAFREFDVRGRKGTCVVSFTRTTVYKKPPVVPAGDVYRVEGVTGLVMQGSGFLLSGTKRWARYVVSLEDKEVATREGTPIALHCDLAADDFASLGADVLFDAVNQSDAVTLIAPSAPR